MSDDVRSIFKENLQMYMTEQNKTQADMARYFGISTATASDWYNGKKFHVPTNCRALQHG